MTNKAIFFFLFISKITCADPLYFCTASDSRYFFHLLNLIGSIHAVNYDDLGEIAIFDLGMTEEQIKTLKGISKVTIHEVEKVHPDIIKPFITVATGRKIVPGWYAWKWVAIRQALDLYPYVLWIDAGSTVLRPLNILFKHIQQNKYFLCTIGMPGTKYSRIGWGATQYVKDKFGLNEADKKWILSQDSVMGGVIGVSREGKDLFLEPMCELAKELRPFEDDGTSEDGFGGARHDQPLLSIISYLNKLTIFKQDETQKLPIYLSIKGYEWPFYITWDDRYIHDNTHIYNSRNNLSNARYFYSRIQWNSDASALEDTLLQLKLNEFAHSGFTSKEAVFLSYNLAQDCIRNDIRGHFIECGVEEGACSAAMAYASQLNNAKKTTYMFDVGKAMEWHADSTQAAHSGIAMRPFDVVGNNIIRWGITEQIIACPGDLDNISSQVEAMIPAISLLNLNERSIAAGLKYLYPKMSCGGYVIINNYKQCRNILEGYCKLRSIHPDIQQVPNSDIVYWKIDKTHRSSYPLITGDTFRSFADHCIDLTTTQVDVEKINQGDIVYVHGDIVGAFIEQIHPHIKNKYILLTHNSDLTMPGLYSYILDDQKLIAWFALNPDIVHPKLYPIPLGHANKFCPSGVISVIDTYAKNKWKLYEPKKELLYMNFKLYNNSNKRQIVQDLFEQQGLCVQAYSSTKPFEQFLAEMAHYKFALSPEGVGPDCHRTWEAMMVGCIPIVLHSPLDSLFDDLPVLIIDDWYQVTPEFLEKKYKEMMHKQYNREKLYINYWRDLLQKKSLKHKAKK